MKTLLKQVCVSILSIVAAVASLGPQPSSAWAQEMHDQPRKLTFVLILTRHGVRSPTWTNERLDEFSTQPWPVWPVAPGLLTPHGRSLMKAFGAFYRESFVSQGLLSGNGCTDVSRVYLWSDTDERTLETGHGIADGLLPGCSVEVHSLGKGKGDPLFHDHEANTVANAQTAFAAVAGRIGNDPAALSSAYHMPLVAMQRVLATCAKQPCSAEGSKNLPAVRASLDLGKGDHLVELRGPLTTAATFAENFQLEYLEGMSGEQLGWGQLDEKEIEDLMALHAASSDLVQRTPSVARAQASTLLQHILETLEQAELGKPVHGAIGPANEKLLFLVGHDTNISNIAALLDVHWLIDGYQRDDAAPGGALVFEIWRRPGDADAVKIYYQVQSPQQMRNSLSLSLAEPPKKAFTFVPGCSRANDDASCNWKDFMQFVETQMIAPAGR